MAHLFGRQTKEQEQRDELLSAYLDDQLNAGERARLEAQLKTDPALQAELEALRHTVALVRDLPPVPIPRNFILPPTMAARPRPAPSARPRRALRAKPQDKAWAAPFLTAATSVASLLFVIVLAGDLLLSRVGRLAFAPASAPLPEAEAPKTELTPPLVEELEAGKTAHPTAAPIATPLPMEAPVEAPLETTAEAERGAVVTPKVTASPAPAMGGGPIEETAAPAPAPSPAEAEELTAAPTMATAAAVAEEEDEGSAEPTPSVVIEPPPSEVEEEEADAAEDRQDAPESEITEPVTISPWRVLEIGLGLTTLGLALATVWAWRARRH